MLDDSLAVIVVWTVLLGIAWLARGRNRFSRSSSVLLVTGGYAVLCILTFLYFGLDRWGFIASFGMLLPYVVAASLVVF